MVDIHKIYDEFINGKNIIEKHLISMLTKSWQKDIFKEFDANG